MDYRNYIFIRSDANDYISKNINLSGFTVISPYSKIALSNPIFRKIMRFHLNSIFPFKSIWYNKKVINKRINENSVVVAFESGINTHFFKHFTRKYKTTKKFLWFWNTVDNTISPLSKDLSDWKLYSFSEVDCFLYQMIFNPAPYFSNNSNGEKFTIKYDVCFVGKDKNRLKKLLLIKSFLEINGYKCKFLITENSRRLFKSKKLSRNIKYSETINLLLESKAILDYIIPANSGLSMRAMESLFFSKKLITNNPLIKNYDFYNSDNIFILGVDHPDTFKKFMEISYNHDVDIYKQNYTFERWLSRFL